MLSAPPAAAGERFRCDLEAVASGAIDAGVALADAGRLALAVSGGPDSVAMLLLAAAACPGRVVAATVDHGLREGSAAEAAGVAELCARLDVPHTVLSPDTAITGSSLQMRARVARYELLCAWTASVGADALLTAHHADDAAETLLMRLNRASGLAGLAGVRPLRFDGGTMILRPLLGWRRAELAAVIEACKAPVVDDPSNHDPRHDRTRYRALLSETPLLDPVALAASARYLAEAEAVVAQAAALLWHDHWHGGEARLAVDGLPRELRRRLVRRAIAEVRELAGIALPAFSDSANIESLLDALERGRGAVHAGVQGVAKRGHWHFRPAPPRRSL